MKARAGVALMAVLLVLYIGLVGQRAVVLLMTGLERREVVPIVMGVSMIVLPAIALWALGREVVFGWQADRLGRILEREGGLPAEVIGMTPSGRPDREQATALFGRYRDAVTENERDWRGWYRLSLAYDAAGDRRRARSSAREAIRRERTAR